MNHYYIYILTNKYDTVFYTGITNNLERRLLEHKRKVNDGFTKKYNINKLMYYEMTTDVNEAIRREKQIKDYRREKKLSFIHKLNPTNEDLAKRFLVVDWVSKKT